MPAAWLGSAWQPAGALNSPQSGVFRPEFPVTLMRPHPPHTEEAFAQHDALHAVSARGLGVLVYVFFIVFVFRSYHWDPCLSALVFLKALDDKKDLHKPTF